MKTVQSPDPRSQAALHCGGNLKRFCATGEFWVNKWKCDGDTGDGKCDMPRVKFISGMICDEN